MNVDSIYFVVLANMLEVMAADSVVIDFFDVI